MRMSIIFVLLITVLGYGMTTIGGSGYEQGCRIFSNSLLAEQSYGFIDLPSEHCDALKRIQENTSDCFDSVNGNNCSNMEYIYRYQFTIDNGDNEFKSTYALHDYDLKRIRKHIENACLELRGDENLSCEPFVCGNVFNCD